MLHDQSQHTKAERRAAAQRNPGRAGLGSAEGKEVMSDMPADLPAEQMWTLLDDETVRLQLPPLPIDGMPKLVRINLDFDAVSVDEMLERLTVLRGKMLPARTRN